MFVAELSQYPSYLGVLAIFYNKARIYPSNDDLRPCEVAIRDSRIWEGSYSLCYKGTFLGRFDVVLKKIRSAHNDTRTEDVGRIPYPSRWF